MLFHSPEFLFLFLPVTWLLYWLLVRTLSLQWALRWVTACSFFFYGWEEPRFLILLLGSLIANYAIVRGLLSAKARNPRLALAWLGVSLNIGVIAAFKYVGFLASAANTLLALDLPVFVPLLPLAISFFSFELIALVVDAYKGKLKSLRFLDLCLFISFFPLLIAGPIVHHNDLIPQFEKHRLRLSRTKLALGLTLFAIGLVKKLLIADTLGDVFDTCRDRLGPGLSLGFTDGWTCMSAQAMRIYFDYSGYADMAMGLAIWFGIRLPWNFLSPYKATSIAGFWRRWNLTLMRFLRNHIYFPLGGSRFGFKRQAFASLATMLLCGLWHGAGWNFVLWGLIVGLLLVAEMVLAGKRQARSFGGIVVGRGMVFLAYVMPLCFFVFPSVPKGLDVLASLFGLNGWGSVGQLGLLRWHLPTLALALVVVYALPNTYQLTARFRVGVAAGLGALEGIETTRLRWRPQTAWALGVALLLTLGLLSMNEHKEFFYFQF